MADGKQVGDKVTVEVGSKVNAPEAPVKERCDFVGWDLSLENITKDTVITANYKLKQFTVTIDGVAQTVEYGKDVKLPTPAEKEGYTFKGWEGQTTGIKADGEVHAIYEKNTDTPGTDTPALTADAAQTGSLAAMILMAFASLTAFFKRGKKSRR